MRSKSLCWWHLTLTTANAWRHGDERGFRSRGHRIHSSGDYKNPPPQGEHEGLRRYHEGRSGEPVVLTPELRRRVGEAVLKKREALGARVLVVAVGGMHVHLLVEWEDDERAAKALAGDLKQFASHVIRDALPGKVWAEGGEPIRIRDREHQLNAYRYILKHADEGAWTWRCDAKAAAVSGESAPSPTAQDRLEGELPSVQAGPEP